MSLKVDDSGEKEIDRELIRLRKINATLRQHVDQLRKDVALLTRQLQQANDRNDNLQIELDVERQMRAQPPLISSEHVNDDTVPTPTGAAVTTTTTAAATAKLVSDRLVTRSFAF